jgi:hypothetical protein
MKIAGQALLVAFLAMLVFSGCQSNEPFTAPSRTEMTVNLICVQQQGLRWLVHSQNKNGSWGVGADEIPAATGLALLAFYWHGEASPSEKYWETVRRGLEFLFTEMQSTNGLACKGGRPAFGHAIAVQALCEGYGNTLNPNLKYACEKGLTEIFQRQRDSGLWDVCYGTDDGKDDIITSVWQVIAMKSGMMAGLEANGCQRVLGKAADAMERILATETDIDKRIGIIWCLQLCGRGRSAVCRNAMDDLATLTPDSESPSDGDPFFRWYLAMQVFYYQGGRRWLRWQELHIPLVLKQQKVTRKAYGEHVGYWDSSRKEQRFSRICTTALALMILESEPPRCLPVFPHQPDEQVIQPGFGDEIEVKVDL